MIEGAKAGAQVTIAKVTPVVKQQPRPTSLTYGETLGDSELRNGAMKVSGTAAPVQPEQPSDIKEDVVPAEAAAHGQRHKNRLYGQRAETRHGIPLRGQGIPDRRWRKGLYRQISDRPCDDKRKQVNTTETEWNKNGADFRVIFSYKIRKDEDIPHAHTL